MLASNSSSSPLLLWETDQHGRVYFTFPSISEQPSFMLKRVFLTGFLSSLPQPGPWQGPKPGFLFSWTVGLERQEEGMDGQAPFSFQPSSKASEG